MKSTYRLYTWSLYAKGILQFSCELVARNMNGPKRTIARQARNFASLGEIRVSAIKSRPHARPTL